MEGLAGRATHGQAPSGHGAVRHRFWIGRLVINGDPGHGDGSRLQSFQVTTREHLQTMRTWEPKGSLLILRANPGEMGDQPVDGLSWVECLSLDDAPSHPATLYWHAADAGVASWRRTLPFSIYRAAIGPASRVGCVEPSMTHQSFSGRRTLATAREMVRRRGLDAPYDYDHDSPQRGSLLAVLVRSTTWIKSSVKIAGASFMLEVIFIVEESPEGGVYRGALGTSIFTEADDWDALQANVRDAVNCHFDEDKAPKLIRLHDARKSFFGSCCSENPPRADLCGHT